MREFLGALLVIILFPFLLLLFIFYIIPLVIVESIKEKINGEEPKPIYNERCNTCPHSEWCSAEEASCDLYGGDNNE